MNHPTDFSAELILVLIAFLSLCATEALILFANARMDKMNFAKRFIFWYEYKFPVVRSVGGGVMLSIGAGMNGIWPGHLAPTLNVPGIIVGVIGLMSWWMILAALIVDGENPYLVIHNAKRASKKHPERTKKINRLIKLTRETGDTRRLQSLLNHL